MARESESPEDHTATQHQPCSAPHKKKRHKPKHWDWLSGPHNPTRGEQAMWVAVITQAVQDALSHSANAEMRYHKHEAIHWLTGNSRDFVTVCLFAELEPDYVRCNAKRTLANPGRWRAEPGKGERYHERKEYRKRLKAHRKAMLAKPPMPQPQPTALVISLT